MAGAGDAKARDPKAKRDARESWGDDKTLESLAERKRDDGPRALKFSWAGLVAPH